MRQKKRCQLGEEIPKQGRKGERNYKPQSSVGMVDIGGKLKIRGNKNIRHLRNRVEQGLP